MEKPVRKRGRPPITKDYANPMESPMAHSSLRMQKQGAQVFQRPTMKVGSVTPSPKNRCFSNPTCLGNGSSGSSEGIVSESHSQPGSVKKARYRGVILSTPTKWPAGGKQEGVSGSSATPTPFSDNVFCSTSRLNLRSSPPSTSPIKDENDGNDSTKGNAARMAGPNLRNSPSQQFKFSLTIGENGRASIAGSSSSSGSSPELTPCKSNYSKTTSGSGKNTNAGNTCVNANINDTNGPNDEREDLGLQTFGRRKVLALLKKMRNDTASASLSGASSMVRKPAHKNEGRNTFSEIELPPIFEANVNVDPDCNINFNRKSANSLPPCSQPSQPPSTPKTSFSIRTGFTPNIGIDQVLLDVVASPKGTIAHAAGENSCMGAVDYNVESQLNYNYLTNAISLSPKPKLQEPSRPDDQKRSMQPEDTRQHREQKQKEQTQNQQQLVFKFSSADPLLMTDDVEGNLSEVIYNHFQNSPRPQTCFNTPPSWVSFGSPRATMTSFTPQLRRDSNYLPQNAAIGNDQTETVKDSRVSQTSNGGIMGLNSSPPRKELFPPSPFRYPSFTHNTTLTPKAVTNNAMMMTANGHNDKLIAEPSTPRNQEAQLSAMVECTPLIQQTMSGSITTKYLSSVLSAGANYDANISSVNGGNGTLVEPSSVKDSMGQSFLGGEQEDARAALKKLIAER